MTEFLIQLGLMVATGGTTWFFSRKKQKAELEGSEIENFAKANQVWQDFIKDLREELDLVRKDNAALKKAVNRLEKSLNDVKKCANADSCPIINKLNNSLSEQESAESTKPAV